MNILLTGANGFIGSYFKDTYNEKYNIKTFSFLNDNLTELSLSGIDTIVHLSALVHQMGGANKEEYENINVSQTLDLVTKAKKSGVKHFIYMSTVKVYGEETNIPYTENTVCKPKDNYGKSKLKAEVELVKLGEDDFIISIIRTPIVYGYGVKANMKNLINLVKKMPILPFSDIKNRRSMVYIGNLCHLIDVLSEKKKNGLFLASDDKALSTKTLIELISNVLNKRVYLIKLPFFKEILKKIKPLFYKRLYESLEIDNSITREDLEFTNLYSVEDGIKFMLHNNK